MAVHAPAGSWLHAYQLHAEHKVWAGARDDGSCVLACETCDEIVWGDAS